MIMNTFAVKISQVFATSPDLELIFHIQVEVRQEPASKLATKFASVILIAITKNQKSFARTVEFLFSCWF